MRSRRSRRSPTRRAPLPAIPARRSTLMRMRWRAPAARTPRSSGRSTARASWPARSPRPRPRSPRSSRDPASRPSSSTIPKRLPHRRSRTPPRCGSPSRSTAREAARRGSARSDDPLVLAGEALAAGVDEERAPAEIARLAAEASEALAALVWQGRDDLLLTGSYGESPVAEAAALSAARVALDSREFATSERIGGAVVVCVRLGEPGVLQLVFADEPSGGALAGIATFALRAASALRNAAHARDAALELAGARALLAVLGQATADLSLEHTLATAIERTAELLGIDRVAVYLRDDGRLGAAAGRSLVGPHEVVADELLGQLLGPYRGRSIVAFDVARDPALAGVQVAAEEAGIASALALPLVAGSGDVIGLLALYPEPGRA